MATAAALLSCAYPQGKLDDEAEGGKGSGGRRPRGGAPSNGGDTDGGTATSGGTLAGGGKSNSGASGGRAAEGGSAGVASEGSSDSGGAAGGRDESGGAVGSGGTSGSGGTQQGGRGGEAGTATFTEIWSRILEPRCASFCHDGTIAAWSGVDKATAYRTLFEADSTSCPGELRVVPGDPEASVLFYAISHTDMPGCDVPSMPAEAAKLPQADIDRILGWILADAPNN